MTLQLDRPAHVVGLVEELRLNGLDVDAGSRRLSEYSYDASNYRVRPLAVVFPRSPVEVANTLSVASRRGVPVTARGGGTSMAGNAVGGGLILDLSRFCRQIHAIDPVMATATVDAGVVLSDLRREVEAQTGGRFTFAPDPSSRNRATIGGSVNNDACGNHSVRDGRMSDHVVALDIVTADGLQLTATENDLRATYNDDNASAQRAVAIKAQLRALRANYADELRSELAKIPRQVSGYHLANLLAENGFNVARALCGSEGTCAVVVKATVRIVPKPKTSILVVVGYRDLVEGARDVPSILTFNPAAVEGIDRVIVDAVTELRGTDAVGDLPAGDAWLYVELAGDDAEELHRRADALVARLTSSNRATAVKRVDDAAEKAALWRVREDGAGLTARLPSGEETWPGWEDSAVSPHQLASYLSELRDLIDSHGLTGVMYGHFGAGCMHIRLTFEQRTARGQERMRDFSRAAAALVSRHGGSLSGEHGDGRARSELLPLMYSERLIAAFGQFKAVWDAHGTLNPSVIVDPNPLHADLALADVPERPWRTPLALHTHGSHSSAGEAFSQSVQRCIGVGRCRSHESGVMCPSYRATHDEKDSTRARARVLQEMIRGADSESDGWRSADVRDALDLCLSCKACSTDCPTGVDMATYKSVFLSQYYRGRVRPVSHYALGWLPAWLKVLSPMSSIVNAVVRSPVRRLLVRIAGVAPERVLPRFFTPRVWRSEVMRSRVHSSAPSDVVLFADTFTRAFRPHVVGAAERVLGAAGRTTECRSDACCGLTWISTGQLGAARRRLSKLVRRFDDGTDRPIIVLEPSCAAALRKDLPELVPTPEARRVSARVRSFASEVLDITSRGEQPVWQDDAPPRVTVQAHCHEYAVFGSKLQAAALASIGITSIDQAEGCCGVAGNFGFEREHYDTSMAVSRLGLDPAIRRTPSETPILADGFSCQLQVTQIDDARRPLHLAELIDQYAPGKFQSSEGEVL